MTTAYSAYYPTYIYPDSYGYSVPTVSSLSNSNQGTTTGSTLNGTQTGGSNYWPQFNYGIPQNNKPSTFSGNYISNYPVNSGSTFTSPTGGTAQGGTTFTEVNGGPSAYKGYVTSGANGWYSSNVPGATVDIAQNPVAQGSANTTPTVFAQNTNTNTPLPNPLPPGDPLPPPPSANEFGEDFFGSVYVNWADPPVPPFGIAGAYAPPGFWPQEYRFQDIVASFGLGLPNIALQQIILNPNYPGAPPA